MGFPEFPIDMQVFSKKHRGDHTDAIMHEAGLQKLAHSGINDGKSCIATLPSLKVLTGLIPRKSFPIWIELMIEDVREVMQDSEVELAPSEFLDVNLDRGFGSAIGSG